MNEFFYNFTVAGDNRGYSYLLIDTAELYSFTRFRLDNDEVFTNVFTLKLGDGEVLACKHGDLDWIDLTEVPPDHFPGCAYPLLLPRALSALFTYFEISCDDASVVGQAQLERDRNVIVESFNGAVRRTFTMDGATPVRIDWGGAVSFLFSNGDESARDTGISFAVE